MIELHYMIDFRCRRFHEILINKLDLLFPHREDDTVINIYHDIEEQIYQRPQ